MVAPILIPASPRGEVLDPAVLGRDEDRRNAVIGVGKSDALLALVEDFQRRHDGVVFAVEQAPDDAVPFMLHQRAFGFHLLAKGLGKIDLEALQFIVLIHEVERRVGALDGDADRCRVLAVPA